MTPFESGARRAAEQSSRPLAATILGEMLSRAAADDDDREPARSAPPPNAPAR